VPAVNTIMFHRRRAERFARLMEEATGGRRQRVRSPLDDQLAELLTVGRRVATLPVEVDIDPDFRTGLREMLVATAEREGIGRTATVAEPERDTAGRRPGRAPSRRRTRGAIVIGVAIGAIAVSGISTASEDAVPGDALYAVKRSAERAQLALASSDVTRGQLYLEFARTRAAEAAVMRSSDAGYSDVLDDMDAEALRGVGMLTTAAVQRRDRAPLAVVDAFAASQRQTLGTLLDRADGGDRERLQRSLAMLNAVEKRVDGLRATLTCESPAAGSDRLGPKPRAC
jgi:hypothetical protein